MIMNRYRVFIIILNWNGIGDTLECLESIKNLEYTNCDIVVVDNGSTDNSVKTLKEKFPKVVILENCKNLGFAGGNNVGIQYALKHKADFVMLLNNDTVVDPKLINHFIEASTKIGTESILGAKIYYFKEPNRIWFAGGKWMKAKSGFIHLGQKSIDDGDKFNTITETEYICGCALFIGSATLRKIGLLNELYFLTFEETDLCYRARKEGVRCYLVPDAKVWHKISVSFGGENSSLFQYYSMRNKLLWAEKNLPLPLLLSLYVNVLKTLSLYIIPQQLRKSYKNEKFLYGKKDLSSRMMYQRHVERAQFLGMRDYALRHFGECSKKVKSLI